MQKQKKEKLFAENSAKIHRKKGTKNFKIIKKNSLNSLWKIQKKKKHCAKIQVPMSEEIIQKFKKIA